MVVCEGEQYEPVAVHAVGAHVDAEVPQRGEREPEAQEGGHKRRVGAQVRQPRADAGQLLDGQRLLDFPGGQAVMAPPAQVFGGD